jgi:ubiquinone/menaquinone biosynthesis C-methylase UbiE
VKIAAWDKVAEETNFNLEIDTPQFIERVPKEERVLDYGCGYGRITELLYQNGYSNIVGIDSSGEMIKRGKLMHPHLSLQKSQKSKLNFPDGIFGAVVVCALLTCLPEHQQKVDVLTEIQRVLKPGGILHIVEFCNESNKTFMSKIGVLMHHQHPEELKSLFTSFTELDASLINTITMGGNNAQVLSYFGQRDT